MKKLLVVSVLFLFATSVFAQKKWYKSSEYTASNGITYKIGDQVKLGMGSADNGDFNHVRIYGMLAKGNNEDRIGQINAGLVVIIKKIITENTKHRKGTYFVVGGGNIVNYYVLIESAIASCEVLDCKKEKKSNPPQPDKYDTLSKIKKLLDDGVLTDDEYQSEKKKILANN